MMIAKIEYTLISVKKILFRLWVAIRYKNKKLRKYHLKNLIVNAEKKYLNRYLFNLENETNIKQKENTKIIWICWLQGIDKMPDIIKSCFNSIKKYCTDYEIIILTNENIQNYVKLPDYIINKKKLGYITNTHFSDILRVSLLAKHGGIWLDATVYLTAPLPQAITNSDFFAYHTNSYVKSNSWLLKSTPCNLLMINMQKLLFAYWKKENKLIDYFLYHIFFDLMIEHNKECEKLWKDVALLYDDCYELEANYFTPYTKEKWLDINNKTTIHKLSWKYKKESINGDFLSHILSNTLGV